MDRTIDFGLQETEEDLYEGDYYQYHIISHGYPTQYIYYIIDRMQANFDDQLKDYHESMEDTINVHFYMNEKDYKRISIMPTIALMKDQEIHFKMDFDEASFEDFMFSHVWITSLHEQEHVFQFWKYQKEGWDKADPWILEALASYKSYKPFMDRKKINLTDHDTFYITDFYSMMGSKWCYDYGFYLIDYLIKEHDLEYLDILEVADVEELTGLDKEEIFEDWKNFMEESYDLVYESESIQ